MLLCLEGGGNSVDQFHNSPAFITAPVSVGKVAFPASWIVDGDKLKVFEYSTDLRVKENIDKIVQNPTAFIEIIKLIRQYGYEDVLSPAIVGREAMEKFDREIPFVENTYENPFRSVVMNQQLSPELEAVSIQTLWSVPMSHACMGVTRCVNFGGGHKTSYYHQTR